MKQRIDIEWINQKSDSPLGRIIVLTGARQTGKTTIAKNCFPDYRYFNIDDVIVRSQLKNLSAAQWYYNQPLAILDEVQIEPQLINSVKAVYDMYPEPRYVLLGSSQFLLLQKVRESLAGRCVIRETYPLTLPEMRTNSFEDIVEPSFFVDFVRNKKTIEMLSPSFVLDNRFAQIRYAYDFYLQFGGYPALTNNELNDNERFEWLENYVKTFLERDIRDLASFRDLNPFIKLQRYLANTTATLVNLSSIAKETGITVPTVQRYLQYMNISYQSISLPAWFSNPLKKLVKAPKIHVLDIGVLRAILQKRGMLNGNEYESAIVSEIYKQLKCNELPLFPYHLRTQDGREIDLLLESEDGFIAIEIKQTENVNRSDAKNFFGLQEILNKPLKHCFVLSNDNQVKSFGEITAMHAGAFLG
ncbi:MAG: ATP-binding protein [Tannerella sp.]|jgi:predicted AAA+ superfamily ATPase|nr:ATP-binding protein [Tannerella sp.]